MIEELQRQATLKKSQLEERGETLSAAHRRANVLHDKHREAMDEGNHGA